MFESQSPPRGVCFSATVRMKWQSFCINGTKHKASQVGIGMGGIITLLPQLQAYFLNTAQDIENEIKVHVVFEKTEF